MDRNEGLGMGWGNSAGIMLKRLLVAILHISTGFLIALGNTTVSKGQIGYEHKQACFSEMLLSFWTKVGEDFYQAVITSDDFTFSIFIFFFLNFMASES